MESDNLVVIGVAFVAVIAIFMMFGLGGGSGITGNAVSDIAPIVSFAVVGKIIFIAAMLAACFQLYFKG